MSGDHSHPELLQDIANAMRAGSQPPPPPPPPPAEPAPDPREVIRGAVREELQAVLSELQPPPPPEPEPEPEPIPVPVVQDPAVPPPGEGVPQTGEGAPQTGEGDVPPPPETDNKPAPKPKKKGRLSWF